MYADREEAESKRSIKERLNGNFRDRRQVAGKRSRFSSLPFFVFKEHASELLILKLMVMILLVVLEFASFEPEFILVLVRILYLIVVLIAFYIANSVCVQFRI